MNRVGSVGPALEWAEAVVMEWCQHLHSLVRSRLFPLQLPKAPVLTPVPHSFCSERKKNKDKYGSGSVLQGQDTCQLLRTQFIQRLLAAAQLIKWQRQPLWLYNRKEAKQCKAAGSLTVKSCHLAKLAVLSVFSRS